MSIGIEVVSALPQHQTIVQLRLEEGATVAEALVASGLFPPPGDGGDAAACKVGIWGRVVQRTQVLRDGDRVEVYRPLRADPKQARRRKAEGERRKR